MIPWDNEEALQLPIQDGFQRRWRVELSSNLHLGEILYILGRQMVPTC